MPFVHARILPPRDGGGKAFTRATMTVGLRECHLLALPGKTISGRLIPLIGGFGVEHQLPATVFRDCNIGSSDMQLLNPLRSYSCANSHYVPKTGQNCEAFQPGISHTSTVHRYYYYVR